MVLCNHTMAKMSFPAFPTGFHRKLVKPDYLLGKGENLVENLSPKSELKQYLFSQTKR